MFQDLLRQMGQWPTYYNYIFCYCYFQKNTPFSDLLWQMSQRPTYYFMFSSHQCSFPKKRVAKILTYMENSNKSSKTQVDFISSQKMTLTMCISFGKCFSHKYFLERRQIFSEVGHKYCWILCEVDKWAPGAAFVPQMAPAFQVGINRGKSVIGGVTYYLLE